jgi:hypothetical protein
MGRIGVDQDLSTHQASEVGLLRREDLNLKEYRGYHTSPQEGPSKLGHDLLYAGAE